MALSKSGLVGFGSVTTITPTFSSGSAVAGRLLICGLTFSTGNGSGLTTPSGWTPLIDCQVTGLRAWLYYKYADGGETSATWTWTSGGFGSAFIAEYDDALTGTPTTAENETMAATPGTTSLNTGTATVAYSTGRAFAFFTGDSGSQVDGGRAYSDGFVEDFGRYVVSTSSVQMASKAISASGGYSCTFSCVDTGDELYGGVFVFQSANAATEGTFSGTIAVGGSVAAYVPPYGSMAGTIAVGGSGTGAVPAIGTVGGTIAVGGSTVGYVGFFGDDFTGADATIVTNRDHWTGYEHGSPSSEPTALRILGNAAYFDALPSSYYVAYPDVKPPAYQTVSANFVAGTPGLVAQYNRPTPGVTTGTSGGYAVTYDDNYNGTGVSYLILSKIVQNNDNGSYGFPVLNLVSYTLTGSPRISLTCAFGEQRVRVNGVQMLLAQDSTYTDGYAGILVTNQGAATGTLDNFQTGTPVDGSASGTIAVGGSCIGNVVVNGIVGGTIQPGGGMTGTFSLAGGMSGVIQVGGSMSGVRGASGTVAGQIAVGGSMSAGHGPSGDVAGLISLSGSFEVAQGAGGTMDGGVIVIGGTVEGFHVRFIADTPASRCARVESASRTALAA